MLMHAIAHGRCTDTVRLRQSTLEVDSGRKIPCRTGDSNPRQYCAWLFSRTLYQLSYSGPFPVFVQRVNRTQTYFGVVYIHISRQKEPMSTHCRNFSLHRTRNSVSVRNCSTSVFSYVYKQPDLFVPVLIPAPPATVQISVGKGIGAEEAV